MLRPLKWLVIALLAGGLLFAVARIAPYFQREPAVNAEDDGRVLSRIVDARLVDAVDLRVKRITGTVQAVATDRRGLLFSSLSMKAPFEADYFVDMAKLGRRDFLWDERTRTLIVIVPDVRVAPVNVDETRATVVTSGLFVTRAAMAALRQRASDTAQNLARTEAEKPAFMDAVRRDGRAAIAALFARPLRIAGADATVKVIYASEAGKGGEQMDRSRSLAEIYGG